MSSNQTTYSIAIAGSTTHTRMCAEALVNDSRFKIAWIMTPSPRKIGRKQEIVKNPLHQFAEQQHTPIIFVEKKIDENVKNQVNQYSVSQIDFLLVVDFGYLIPTWMLNLPRIAPINVHPSDLPKYRGSSPGQFTLLYGENHSAVSVIIMNESLDEGDIIAQDALDVPTNMSAPEFYNTAFRQIATKLPNILSEFAADKIVAVPQPTTTPTPIARRLTREDGYVPWELLTGAPKSLSIQHPLPLSPLLHDVNEILHNWPQTIANAVRALSPWPGVWTIITTAKGEKRLKILEVDLTNNLLTLKKVQLEGLQPTSFTEINNQIILQQ